MDIRPPFELEHCGCFYKICLKPYKTSYVKNVDTVINKLRDYEVVDFKLTIVDIDGKLYKSELQSEDNTRTDFTTNITYINDVSTEMEWCNGNMGVIEFYILFKVGDVD